LKTGPLALFKFSSSKVFEPEVIRALLGSNPSAEAETKTEKGDYLLPSFNLFGIGLQAINLRGLGTESPEINHHYPHQIAKNPKISHL